jgi:hypothetical protein
VNLKCLDKKNIGEKLHDSGVGNNFFDMTPKAEAIKEKLNFIKLKSLIYERNC